MFEAFKAALIKYKRPFVLLKGDKKTRLATATKHINQLLEKNDEVK